VSIDTACSSSFVALDTALRAIRTGQCDAAIVGGTNTCIQPSAAAILNKLQMLSADGTCRVFDESGMQCRMALGLNGFFRRLTANELINKVNSRPAKVFDAPL
jgi:acetyl-CoA acetyltransferase